MRAHYQKIIVNMFTTLKGTKRSFTLIELLVVIAIIGILSSVVLASLGTARQKARDATRISDMKNIQLALELYYDTYQNYPPNTAGTANAHILPTSGAGIAAGLIPTYIPNIPVDPRYGRDAAGTNDTYKYHYVGLTNTDADCPTASVVGSGGCFSYILGATLEVVNVVTQQDQDFSLPASSIYGVSNTQCGAAVAGTGPEMCYSIRP